MKDKLRDKLKRCLDLHGVPLEVCGFKGYTTPNEATAWVYCEVMQLNRKTSYAYIYFHVSEFLDGYSLKHSNGGGDYEEIYSSLDDVADRIYVLNARLYLGPQLIPDNGNVFFIGHLDTGGVYLKVVSAVKGHKTFKELAYEYFPVEEILKRTYADKQAYDLGIPRMRVAKQSMAGIPNAVTASSKFFKRYFERYSSFGIANIRRSTRLIIDNDFDDDVAVIHFGVLHSRNDCLHVPFVIEEDQYAVHPGVRLRGVIVKLRDFLC